MPFIGLSSQFTKLLDKATSNYKLDPDWPSILSICDLIRQGDVSPKQALAAINKKITHENPHVAGFGLLVLESCVKNCGSLIHDEVCTKQYMEQLKEIAKTTQQEPVRNKILELIQAWAHAFRDQPKYRAVQDTMRIMKTENFIFPDLQYSDAMFTADIAPEWVDGDKCHRCRQAFTTFNRKHHCRACGQVFCAQCSGKFCVLPKYGIEKEVRVCITCYDQVNKPIVTPNKETDLPIEYLTSSLAQQQQVPPRKTEDELREEEELQIALALSQSEAEEKEKEKKRATSAIMSNATAFAKVNYSPPPSPSPSPLKIQEEEEVDPELAKYLNRQYWEQRQSALEAETSRLNVTSPSAPNIGSPMPQKVIAIKQQNGEVDPEMKNFVDALRSQVEIFVNRMKSDSSRGRSIAYDSSVQTLFMNITALHSKLLRYIQDQEDKRVYYEGLQDKLTQIKDARGALDALREEHRLALLREKQEAERKKQMQMAQKLEIMRKKKQEYLQMQRQLALDRIQEQEREMQMRQEQQKQQYKMAGAYSGVPGFPMGISNQGSPVRQVQYSGGEINYSSIPTASQTQPVYAYPPGATGTYAVSGNYIMQHPHQPSMIDTTAMSDQTKPTTDDNSANQSHESLGRVTVSGPGMQHPSISGQLQGPPAVSANHIPQATGPSVVSHPSHIPTVGQPAIPQSMAGPQTQGIISSHMGPSQQSPNTTLGHMLPPGIASSQGGPQIVTGSSIMQRQQIMIGSQNQGHTQQAMTLGRQMALAGQIGAQAHSFGPNMPVSGSGGHMIITSNSPMSGPQQMQSAHQMQGPQQVTQGPQQLQGPQQICQGPQQMQGPQQIPQASSQMQGPQQIPQGPQRITGIPSMPTLQDLKLPLLQTQMQHPEQQPQQQEQQILRPEEKERTSPEVGELITFD